MLTRALDSGAKLEIVNTTVAFGGRTVSAVTEVRPRLSRGLLSSTNSDSQIWDVTNKRLCMTGVHNKMAPSKPAAKL